ncbi:hypothetical protein V6N12_067176 [Hibiscus sabdariffa]|uniref:Uncharacterized protein n=1 Tax=Hibiscus sabdariffa TaxID=183260 RepID=A0ABR2BUB4_9ROSI
MAKDTVVSHAFASVMNGSATEIWGRRPFTMMDNQMGIWEIVQCFKLSIMALNEGYGIYAQKISWFLAYHNAQYVSTNLCLPRASICM